MSRKYVLTCATVGSWRLYWTDFMDSVGSGISVRINYTANLSEAKIYDTIESALADIPATKSGPIQTAEFEPLEVDDKKLFAARLGCQ